MNCCAIGWMRPRGHNEPVSIRARFRATGADLPFADPLPWHGVSMEGYFWRLTDPVSGRVVIALVGANTPADGRPWATVGIAAEPGGVLRTAVVPHAWPDAHRLGVTVSDCVRASAEHVRVCVDDCVLDVRIDEKRPWPHRLFGGSSWFQVVPGLNQYWHPWLLGGRAVGHVVLGDEHLSVDGWQVYAEKNWGRGGFPTAWWWGQAQGFPEPVACVAFAGGVIIAGPQVAGRRWSTEVTALVVALPDGRVVRLGNPVTSPVVAHVEPGRWRLQGRSARWQIDLEAEASPEEAFVLPVPLVEERRNVPGDLEQLAGHLTVVVREWGREVWRGETSLAALEIGGREAAEAELASRGGDPRPVGHG